MTKLFSRTRPLCHNALSMTKWGPLSTTLSCLLHNYSSPEFVAFKYGCFECVPNLRQILLNFCL